MAEEYADSEGSGNETYEHGLRQGFLAGYQAAKELYAAKLKEANDTVAGMADECEGLKTIIYDHDETNLLTPAKWISVKDRLPEVDKYVLVTHRTSQDYTNLKVMEACRISDDEYEIWGDHVILADYVDYWMPLPETPKGEG